MIEKSTKDGIKPVIITVDSRETRSGIALKLKNIPGVSLEQAELTSGDYLIGTSVAVERKAASDFVISLMEGRLFDQLARMVIEYERAIVLVEGNIYETRSAISPESLDGALSYISLLSGASLIHSPSLARTPFILHRMALHVQNGLGYEIPLRAKPKGLTAAQYILEGLPGVGPKLAQALLAHFGTPRAVFSATREELLQVKGLGPKSADTIISALS
ncbi:ERCC4 domain-containing protein [Sulfuricystis multivorans]|uniref:ERCC4 domain-containing protein n=1 Tax=Sulfuricystis multivorans TaxID=2211108 RepID=UPI000F830FAC|nr:ERCC4 domain-containing protein [Sulfuricystis multivorans]